MTLNRVAKNKSEDAMNAWSYAVVGDKLKKIDKKLIKKKFRSEIKNDTLREIKSFNWR